MKRVTTLKIILRHLSSFLAPIVVCIVIPFLIVDFERQNYDHPVLTTLTSLLAVGIFVCAIGLMVFIATIRMFIMIGNGTIMPWNPARKLITASLYGHVRNPMILSLITILVGESIMFASYGIALFATLNFVINTIYFIFSEEPGLEKRFGEEYVEYKKNVPRWVPRFRRWRTA